MKTKIIVEKPTTFIRTYNHWFDIGTYKFIFDGNDEENTTIVFNYRGEDFPNINYTPYMLPKEVLWQLEKYESIKQEKSHRERIEIALALAKQNEEEDKKGIKKRLIRDLKKEDINLGYGEIIKFQNFLIEKIRELRRQFKNLEEENLGLKEKIENSEAQIEKFRKKNLELVGNRFLLKLYPTMLIFLIILFCALIIFKII
jgi:hypothetical protein